MRASAEWRIAPSRSQPWRDYGALLLLLLAVYLQLPWHPLLCLLILAPVAAVAGLVLRWQPEVSALGYQLQHNTPQWWLELDGKRYRVRWRDGCVRRRDYLILHWSWWPWQRLIIRPDSCVSREEFRRLKAALYGVA